MRRFSVLVTPILCITLVGCGSMISPSGNNPTFAGQWNGRLLNQGTAIQFTVSDDQHVTSITIDYAFNGCTGTKVLSNLRLPITRGIAGRTPNLMGFEYDTGPSVDTGIAGHFESTVAATGTAFFVAYSGCGNGADIWQASRR